MMKEWYVMWPGLCSEGRKASKVFEKKAEFGAELDLNEQFWDHF